MSEVVVSSPAKAAYRSSLSLFVNGVRHTVEHAKPSTTLLDWLRSIGLTGTKLGCGEGGCGACTVMISTFDRARGEVRHAAVNACLMPLCAADWTAVTTVEGIGTSSKPQVSGTPGDDDDKTSQGEVAAIN